MDLPKIIKLKDSKEMIDIETNFKLCAGPGAGKTTFLINHINNIVSNSTKISKIRKVACITYTNIGVDTIVDKLKNSMEYVEVSTIHSFLYKNIIKPYLWILNDEYKFDYENIDGHEDVIATYSILKEWKENTNQMMFNSDKELANALKKLKWKISTGKNVKLEFEEIYHGKVGKYNIKKTSYIEYKLICWKYGLISHDDVLSLSYKIITKQPRILQILRAKFPYILIDEFQDTNPIQSEIIKKIAEIETIVGVIGDACQSIYKFQGATVEEFEKFKLKKMKVYKIEDNRRSTQEIIDVLNDMRKDKLFKQVSIEGKKGIKPYILVGSFFDTYKKAIEISNNELVYTLAYKKEIANIIKYGFDDYFDEEDTFNELLFSDSERGKRILYVIHSLEYCRQNKIKDAIKYMKKAYRKVESFGDKEALLNMQKLINDYEKISNMNIKDFFNNYLYNSCYEISKISRGKINNYYEELTYKKIAITINIADDNSTSRTIHKAKGDEFDNVLVVIEHKKDFNEDKALEFLLNSDMSKEEHRVYYVALSRAKERLFISVPALSENNRKMLAKFKIIDVNDFS